METESLIMPIYEYQAREEGKSCSHCQKKFEAFQKITDQPLQKCPDCGSPVSRQISACALGASKSGLDSRAKSAGFTKLVKRDKGTYEKMY